MMNLSQQFQIEDISFLNDLISDLETLSKKYDLAGHRRHPTCGARLERGSDKWTSWKRLGKGKEK